MTEAPDVDLADGNFYASREARAAYRWMRANQPVFRDRNGLAAASTYQAVIDAERQPELFSNAGGIRPDQPALPMMIDMDDPAHLLRRKLVNAGFTRKRVKPALTSLRRNRCAGSSMSIIIGRAGWSGRMPPALENSSG